MASGKKTVSVIIVNFNSAKFLGPCLETVRGQDYGDIELVLVDNGSHDESWKIAEKSMPGAKVILNNANVGFPAGMNIGIANSVGRYILALNFDCFLEKDFVGKLVDRIEGRKDFGSACGKIFRMNEDFSRTNILDSTGHLMIDRGPDRRGWNTEDTGLYEKMDIVFGAPGNAALYKREMLDDIAFEGEWFDASFFLNLEDIDVDWRANIFGWHCLYVPDAVCHHVTRAAYKTVEKSVGSRLARKYTVNRRLVALKNDDMKHVVDTFPTMIWQSLRPYKRRDKVWDFDFMRYWMNIGPALRKRKYNNKRRKVSFQEMEYWFRNGSKPVE